MLAAARFPAPYMEAVSFMDALSLPHMFLFVQYCFWNDLRMRRGETAQNTPKSFGVCSEFCIFGACHVQGNDLRTRRGETAEKIHPNNLAYACVLLNVIFVSAIIYI